MTISPSPTNDAPLRTERRHHRRAAADRLPHAPVSSPEENSIGTSEEYSLGAQKAYRRDPTPHCKATLRAPFDRIFKRRTGFVALDRLLTLLHTNKAELLRVLERPEIPLHTNGSENDIRCQVTRRRISGGTCSDAGRDCRDAFLALATTCAKLGISFWHYLGARLAVASNPAVSYLPHLVSQSHPAT